MRFFWYLLSVFILLSSCAKKKEVKKVEKTKDYAVISGVFKNSTENHFMIIGKHINHRIDLSEDGSFLDTITIKVVTTNGFKINNKLLPLFIKNGYHLSLHADINNFPKTLQYSGSGSRENEYLLAQYNYGLNSGNVGANGIFSLEEADFFKRLKIYQKDLDSIDLIYTDIDPYLLSLTKNQNIKSIGLLKNLYETSKDAIKKQKEAVKKLVKGTPSPTFKNYVSLAGNFVSLKDFRGSYVYIDIWGTWIKKYTEQSSAINAFKKKYSNKNIKFLTLCADNRASSGTISYAKQKWKMAIEKNKLVGTHLFIGNDREFLKEYQVLFLPRYILIDPKGNIVDAMAPAPYDEKIKKLFQKLNLK